MTEADEARDRETSPARLAELALSTERNVAKFVAENPNTPVETLAMLATNADVWVRRRVASNPNTPAEVASLMANDEDKEVRQAILDYHGIGEGSAESKFSKARKCYGCGTSLGVNTTELLCEECTKPRPSPFPEDLNDRMAWPDSIDIDALLERVNELSLKTFRAILLEEVITGEDGYLLAVVRQSESSDVVERLRWLQEPLYVPDSWTYSHGTSFHEDFLDSMWTILAIVGQLPDDPKVTTPILRSIMDDPDIWVCPVAPAALLSVKPVDADAVNDILETFCDAWVQDAQGAWVFRGSARMEADAAGSIRGVPLIAIAAVHPLARLDLVRKTADICSTTSVDDAFAVEFWEYVSGCLARDRLNECWIPTVWWQDGFFANGLPEGTPTVGDEQIRALARIFVRGYQSWNLVNVWGSETTAASTATLLAARPELDDELLREFAVLPFAGVRSAVISNPSSSVDTKAIAALQ